MFLHYYISMRIAVISDTHANEKNLNKGLEDIAQHEPDEVWCLGDLVGYGNSPEETVEKVRNSCDIILAGNHDYAASYRFPEFLEVIPHWLKQTLNVQERMTSDNFKYLCNLEPVAERKELDTVLCHASPRDPVMEFLSEDNGEEFLQAQQHFIQLVGHTHRPLALAWKDGKMFSVSPWDKEEVDLNKADKWILNPGSLGTKQFHIVEDRRSGWMLLDLEAKDKKATWFRID